MSKGISVSIEELIQLRHEAEYIRLSNRQPMQTYNSGDYRSAFRGRGMDFEEARIYQPGDDVRTMDWRVTARTATAHTKVYREERERPVIFIVDFTNPMYFGTKVAYKSVIAARIAAILAWAAIRNGDRVGGVIFSEQHHCLLRPHGRNYGMLPLLKNLAKFSQYIPNVKEDNSPLANAFSRAKFLAKPGSLIFILSDYSSYYKNAEKYLAQLASHYEIKAGFIYDLLEKEPPPPNRYAVSDGTHTISMNTAQAKFCHQYRSQFNSKLKKLRIDFAKKKIGFFEIATNQPLAKTLRALL